MTSRSWKLNSPMDTGLEHSYSMFPSTKSTVRSSLLRMRIQVIGALTRPQLMMSLRPSWPQTLTLSFSVVVCFLFAMGTTDSRHGQATLRGSIVMTESGITQWTTFA
jgi:hypothetical protein